MKRKNILFWYASVCSFTISLICFFMVIIEISEIKLLLLVLSILISSCLTVYANNQLRFKEGYTLLQAIEYYKNCCKENICEPDEFQKNKKQAHIIAQQNDCTQSLSSKALATMFMRGYEAYALKKDYIN